MSVTPAMIAVALGVAAPAAGSGKEQQWQMWIDDADNQISWRAAELAVTEPIDEAKRDYVVRQAVVAHADNPTRATQVTTSVDDGSTSKTYRSAKGVVEIADEWWSLLGLTPSGGQAFGVDTVSTGVMHAPWCDLHFGGASCSCGVSLGMTYRLPGDLW